MNVEHEDIILLRIEMMSFIVTQQEDSMEQTSQYPNSQPHSGFQMQTHLSFNHILYFLVSLFQVMQSSQQFVSK